MVKNTYHLSVNGGADTVFWTCAKSKCDLLDQRKFVFIYEAVLLVWVTLRLRNQQLFSYGFSHFFSTPIW